MVIIVKVVHSLTISQCHVVDVYDLSGPLEVEERRPNVFIFKPPFLDKRFSEFMIASFYNEHFLVIPAAVLSLPGLHVGDLAFFFLSFVVLLFLLY